MTLLHDSTFTFFDGTTARVFLCAYKENDPAETMTGTVDGNNNRNDNVLVLYITYTAFNKVNSHPLFVSDLKLTDYCLPEDLRSLDIHNGLIEGLSLTTAARINGKLKLVPTA